MRALLLNQSSMCRAAWNDLDSKRSIVDCRPDHFVQLDLFTLHILLAGSFSISKSGEMAYRDRQEIEAV
jgi:hypothetical protein